MAEPSIYEFETAASAASSLTANPGDGLSALTSGGIPVTLHSPNGAVGEAYVDANGQIIISYQGTQTSSQLEADLLMSANAPVTSIAALSDALNFVGTVKSAVIDAGLNPQNISVTGFSLGGNLAEYVASKTGLPGISFAGSGLPNYVAPSVPAQNFISFVETGDPWANRASDTALSPIVAGQDHYGRVEVIGNPADTSLTSAIVSSVKMLVPAMLTGHGAQALQAVVNDWDNAFTSRHVNGSYYPDINALPSEDVSLGNPVSAAASSEILMPSLEQKIGGTMSAYVSPTSHASIGSVRSLFPSASTFLTDVLARL